MKKSAEILAEIREKSAKAEALEAAVKAAKWSEKNAPEIAAKAQEAELLRVECKVLHDNARRALYAEVMPIVCETLKKYDGKPYGEKTEKKIADEIKSRCNIHFYMRREYKNTALHLVPLNSQGYSGTMFNYQDFDIYGEREKIGDEAPQALDENNKIHAFPPEAFRLSYCAPYIDDARAHAEKILAEFAALKKARDEYREKISAFNDLLPSWIGHANEREPKNYLI